MFTFVVAGIVDDDDDDDINNTTAVVVTAAANAWIELMPCLWFNSYGAIVKTK